MKKPVLIAILVLISLSGFYLYINDILPALKGGVSLRRMILRHAQHHAECNRSMTYQSSIHPHPEGWGFLERYCNKGISQGNYLSKNSQGQENEGGPEIEPHPLSIAALKQGEYPGSDITIEQNLNPGSNYDRYIASYKSEGLKIYGLLTIPKTNSTGEKFPAIIFNHGYISPSIYKTTEKYTAYQDAFARNDYITYKPDYRGHGNSEGEALGGYGSNDYTIDVLNAVSSIQRMQSANPQKIGMWGHSMGGHITLESMVVNPDIIAGVIWAGVVGSYEDLYERWRRRSTTNPTPTGTSQRGRWRQQLAEQYGDPDQNPQFWQSLSATSYVKDIQGSIQLQHGTADASVPIEFSRSLKKLLIEAGKNVELVEYQSDDHNLSANLSLALTQSVSFFDRHLK